MDNPDWRDIATKAMRTKAGFERMLIELDPAIRNIARQYCQSDVDGAMQEAKLKLYQSIYQERRVNLTLTSNTIRAYLHRIVRHSIININRYGAHGMYGRGRSRKGEVSQRPDVIHIGTKTDEESSDIADYAALSRALSRQKNESTPLPFPLTMYLEFFEHHGTLIGAAVYCEERYGYCAKKIDAAFRRVVAQMQDNSI